MGNCEGNQILEETHVPLLGRLGPVVNLYCCVDVER